MKLSTIENMTKDPRFDHDLCKQRLSKQSLETAVWHTWLDGMAPKKVKNENSKDNQSKS